MKFILLFLTLINLFSRVTLQLQLFSWDQLSNDLNNYINTQLLPDGIKINGSIVLNETNIIKNNSNWLINSIIKINIISEFKIYPVTVNVTMKKNNSIINLFTNDSSSIGNETVINDLLIFVEGMVEDDSDNGFINELMNYFNQIYICLVSNCFIWPQLNGLIVDGGIFGNDWNVSIRDFIK